MAVNASPQGIRSAVQARVNSARGAIKGLMKPHQSGGEREGGPSLSEATKPIQVTPEEKPASQAQVETADTVFGIVQQQGPESALKTLAGISSKQPTGVEIMRDRRDAAAQIPGKNGTEDVVSRQNGPEPVVGGSSVEPRLQYREGSGATPGEIAAANTVIEKHGSSMHETNLRDVQDAQDRDSGETDTSMAEVTGAQRANEELREEYNRRDEELQKQIQVESSHNQNEKNPKQMEEMHRKREEERFANEGMTEDYDNSDEQLRNQIERESSEKYNNNKKVTDAKARGSFTTEEELTNPNNAYDAPSSRGDQPRVVDKPQKYDENGQLINNPGQGTAATTKGENIQRQEAQERARLEAEDQVVRLDRAATRRHVREVNTEKRGRGLLGVINQVRSRLPHQVPFTEKPFPGSEARVSTVDRGRVRRLMPKEQSDSSAQTSSEAQQRNDFTETPVVDRQQEFLGRQGFNEISEVLGRPLSGNERIGNLIAEIQAVRPDWRLNPNDPEYTATLNHIQGAIEHARTLQQISESSTQSAERTTVDQESQAPVGADQVRTQEAASAGPEQDQQANALEQEVLRVIEKNPKIFERLVNGLQQKMEEDPEKKLTPKDILMIVLGVLVGEIGDNIK